MKKSELINDIINSVTGIIELITSLVIFGICFMILIDLEFRQSFVSVFKDGSEASTLIMVFAVGIMGYLLGRATRSSKNNKDQVVG